MKKGDVPVARGEQPRSAPGALTVGWATTAEEFKSFEPHWNALLARSGVDSIFLTFEWLWTWWEHFGAGHRLLVAVVRRAERVVALVPWMISKREGFRQVQFVSHKLTDRKDFIIDGSEDRHSVMRLVLGSLDRLPGWDLLLMDRFSEESVCFPALKAVLAEYPQQRSMLRKRWVAPYVAIEGDWDRFWNQLGAKFRISRKYNMNRLHRAKRGPVFQFKLDADEIDAWVDRFAALHISQWKTARGDYSLFEDPAMVRFYKALAHRTWPSGWVRMSALLLENEVAAMDLSFEYQGIFYGTLTCYDPRFASFSPGQMLQLELLREAFVRPLREFDLMSGGESYKLRFHPKARDLYGFGFFSGGMRSQLARIWFFSLRPTLDRLSNSRLRTLHRWYRGRSMRRG
jgi:CelD/BcsL family acetyltransferase involved in cellulose biosynthesis